MKKTIILFALSVCSLSACNSHNKAEASTSTTTDSTQVFACSMDPEITGKKGDKCSKCGMDLTEAVAEKQAEHDHEVKKDSL